MYDGAHANNSSPGAPVREGRAEGQDVVGGPRPIISQEPLGNVGKATSKQAIRAPNQSYVGLTQDTDSETPWPMRTLQFLAPDPKETAQQERREAQWAQDARELGETDYIRRYYADKLGLVSSVEKYMGLSEGRLVNASLLDAAARVQLRHRWKGVQTREITTYLRRLIQRPCSQLS